MAMSEMNLLDLLEEVIEGHILPKLEWNDLLRFRRVCKTAHDITTKYMKVHPELAPEIEITEDGDRSLKAFMEMGIPTTKIYLDTEASGFRFYEKNDKDIDRFLKEYGKQVKSLRVKELTLFVHGKEYEFLGKLVNLEKLEADYFGAGTGTTANQVQFVNAITDTIDLAGEERVRVNEVLPKLLAPLKKLTIKVGQRTNLQIPGLLTLALLQGFTTYCPGIEYMSLPLSTFTRPYQRFRREESWDPNTAMASAYTGIRVSLTHRVDLDEKINLKFIDLENFHVDLNSLNALQMLTNGWTPFLELCELCLEEDIKLLNVGALWFPDLITEPESAWLGKLVLSLVNLKLSVLHLDMTNLEKITILEASKCNTVLFPGQVRPAWNRLTTLEINVDSKGLKTKQLFNLFFKNVRRVALTELCLKFQDGKDVDIPKTGDIVNACPNLKKLTIFNWQGTNKALVKLWNGLPGLEEVCLEDCAQLGNVAFVGEDPRNPAFLKLKKLKKLSLKGLDQMPKITNTLFSMVMRHLTLSHLTITSKDAISSVTLAGVKSLLDGPFKESIQRFPFSGWYLKNVSPEEIQATEKMFRSYNML